MGRSSNIWAHIDSGTINNTRNYSKNFSQAIQGRVMLIEVVKIDEVGRVILSLRGA